VSGSGVSWTICKSASLSRQITMPAPHHSVFYRPDALPAAQPTVSKHGRQIKQINQHITNTKVLNTINYITVIIRTLNNSKNIIKILIKLKSCKLLFDRSLKHNNNNYRLRPLYRSTCIGWHSQLRTGGFCWCKVLLPACPCWWQPAHLE